MKTYAFSYEQGDGKNKLLFGGKGANLCEMTQIGLNVPPGFVITTEACLDHLKNPADRLPDELMAQVKAAIADLEKKTGKGLGNADNPLLVSVRSGSAIWMPGMMDTILNLGLNAETLQGLIRKTSNPRFGWDTYRRFIQLFGKIALGISDEKFDREFQGVKLHVKAKEDTQLEAVHLEYIAKRFLQIVEKETGKPFPQDPMEQMEIAIKAVFGSWMGKRAIDYRKQFNITPDMANGTAVNICTMVFGNLGNRSATGVAFTRMPDTGENKFFGEYLVNAQGEDVVAGIRTPKQIEAMREEMPQLYEELDALRHRLEKHYREVQDFEFTIEEGTLYCLQTRNGKMSAAALIRSSVEMVNEGLITKDEAVMRVDATVFLSRYRQRFKTPPEGKRMTSGLPGSPGVASGHIVFSASDAVSFRSAGKPAIFVCIEVSPGDLDGIEASEGVLALRGGMTSHAAVAARFKGKPCVCRAEGMRIDLNERSLSAGDQKFREGDFISLDGSRGIVYAGVMEYGGPQLSDDERNFLQWCDKVKSVNVVAKVATADEAKLGFSLGGQDILLADWNGFLQKPSCDTLVKKLIFARNVNEREPILRDIFCAYRDSLIQIMKLMPSGGIATSLLDADLARFIPSSSEGLSDWASQVGCDVSTAKLRIAELRQFSDLIAQSGCRLAIIHPEVLEAQIEAIYGAIQYDMQLGVNRRIGLILTNIADVREVDSVVKALHKACVALEASSSWLERIELGLSIECPRALIVLDTLVDRVEFINFDLPKITEALWGVASRGGRRILSTYGELGIISDNPILTFDAKGVGKAIANAISNARKQKPNVAFGVECGRVCDLETLLFFEKLKPKYVSCHPQHVPLVRAVAAKARLMSSTDDH